MGGGPHHQRQYPSSKHLADREVGVAEASSLPLHTLHCLDTPAFVRNETRERRRFRGNHVLVMKILVLKRQVVLRQVVPIPSKCLAGQLPYFTGLKNTTPDTQPRIFQPRRVLRYYLACSQELKEASLGGKSMPCLAPYAGVRPRCHRLRGMLTRQPIAGSRSHFRA